MTDLLAIDLSDDIATLTLAQATMPPALFSDIEAAFRDLSARPALRAVVVRAAGKAFSYGLDLPAAFSTYGAMFQGGGAATRMQLVELIRELQAAFNAIEQCPVPVIAAIHGWCIGGGLDLVSACDVRIASRDAVFSLRETKIAIVADLGSLQRVPRIVGPGVARELAFTGKDIGAERALAVGLVNQVCEDREAAWEAARAMALEIAANPPLTVRGVKQVMNYSADRSVADGLAYVAAWNAAFLASEDLGEAAAAFIAKRKPVYRGA
jgi:enoyl-CoA hydratase